MGNFGGKYSSFVQGFQKGLSPQATPREAGWQQASDRQPHLQESCQPGVDREEPTLLQTPEKESDLGCRATPTLQAGKLRLEKE